MNFSVEPCSLELLPILGGLCICSACEGFVGCSSTNSISKALFIVKYDSSFVQIVRYIYGCIVVMNTKDLAGSLSLAL